MKRIAQVVTASGFVQAVVRPSEPLAAPSGMTFIEIEDDEADPCGMWWDGDEFVSAQP